MNAAAYLMAFALMVGGCFGGRALMHTSVDATTGQAIAKARTVRFGGVVDATNCDFERAVVVSRGTADEGTDYTVHLGTASIRSFEDTALRCEDLSVGDVVDVRGAVRQNGEVEASSVELERASERDGNGEGGGNRTSPGF